MAKGAGRLGVVGLLAAGVAVGGAYLADCVPGFGMGGAGNTAARSSSQAPEVAPAKVPVEAPKPGESGLVIKVTGDRCTVAGKDPGACAELCEQVAAGTAGISRDGRVRVDATFGSHGAVEALRACLIAAGHSDVSVQAE